MTMDLALVRNRDRDNYWCSCSIFFFPSTRFLLEPLLISLLLLLTYLPALVYLDNPIIYT